MLQVHRVLTAILLLLLNVSLARPTNEDTVTTQHESSKPHLRISKPTTSPPLSRPSFSPILIRP